MFPLHAHGNFDSGSSLRLTQSRGVSIPCSPEPITLRRRSFRSGNYPALRTSELMDDHGNRIAYVRLYKFDHAATKQLAAVLSAEEDTGASTPHPQKTKKHM